jgi:hypothetical protein
VPVPSVAPRAAAATRRAALGGALATLAAVSACDLAQPADQPVSGSGGPSGDASLAPSGEAAGAPSGEMSTPPEDPDAALVDEVLADLGELAALVSAAARFAPLRAPMRALAALHAAHLEALGGEASAGKSPGVGFAGPAEALRRVRAAEQQAQRRLADWSVAAESGALARLLASMSAAVAQHLVALPATVRADR